MPGEASFKYAHIEQERRFLLHHLPAAARTVPPRGIHDRYVDGTRLRLRLVERAGMAPEHKLGHKVRLEGPSPLAVAHTTIYLDDAEFAMLLRLPGAELHKTRRTISCAGAAVSIDVFQGRLTGLVLAETDEPIQLLDQLVGVLGAVREVTSDDRFSGGRLARTTSAELRLLLTEHGVDGALAP